MKKKKVQLSRLISQWQIYMKKHEEISLNIIDSLVLALKEVIPDIECLRNCYGVTILFHSDEYDAKYKEVVPDFESGEKRLWEIVCEVFPGLRGYVDDICVVVSPEKQEEIKKSLSKLEKIN